MVFGPSLRPNPGAPLPAGTHASEVAVAAFMACTAPCLPACRLVRAPASTAAVGSHTCRCQLDPGSSGGVPSIEPQEARTGKQLHVGAIYMQARRAHPSPARSFALCDRSRPTVSSLSRPVLARCSTSFDRVMHACHINSFRYEVHASLRLDRIKMKTHELV